MVATLLSNDKTLTVKCAPERKYYIFRLIKSSFFSGERVCFVDNKFQGLGDNIFQ